MERKIIIGFIFLCIIIGFSFLAGGKKEKQYVLKGSLQDMNQLMKAVKMSTIPHTEGIKIEDWINDQIILQLDSTYKK